MKSFFMLKKSKSWIFRGIIERKTETQLTILDCPKLVKSYKHKEEGKLM